MSITGKSVLQNQQGKEVEGDLKTHREECRDEKYEENTERAAGDGKDRRAYSPRLKDKWQQKKRKSFLGGERIILN